MHFTTLYLLKGETLDNVSLSSIEQDFSDRFCYCYGETRPKYRYWCDWFQIGGRWCDMIQAKRGIVGKRSWANKDDEPNKDHYSIVEVKDMEGEIGIDINSIYAIATKSRIFETDIYPDKVKKIIQDINEKKFKGVIAFIDCHD